MRKKVKLYSYAFCEYCGLRLVDQPRKNEFNKYTGKQLFWLQCPKYKNNQIPIVVDIKYMHSRWIKELVTNLKDDL